MIIIIINHEVCYDIHKHNPGCAMGYIFTYTVQGGRSWQPFGEGHKCVVFARNCKFANLIQYNMQYIPCYSALLFCPKSSKKCVNRGKS